MLINLSDEQADAMRTLLGSTLRELSYEIASADLPSYRLMLRGRRETFRAILRALDDELVASQTSGT